MSSHERIYEMNNLIMHIVGNRPQFIKLAPISREIRRRGYKEIIIHTGQHFDENMSDIFFEELDIPNPDENLHVSGGGHSEMTAKIMLALESVILKYNPKVVILYGDTNSTLAAALVVRKLNIPIVHIEAGIRTKSQQNPEEVNRVITDHVSSLLCAADRESKLNLENEGLGADSYFTGDVMYDAFMYYANKVNVDEILSKYELHRKDYILMTWHRQENTSDAQKMKQILNLVKNIGRPVICPLHPRTRIKLGEYGLMDEAMNIKGFKMIQPVGYLEMIALTSNCSMILTDSGGLSKESYFAGVKCVFMLEVSVWPDLEQIGWIRHVSRNNKIDIDMIQQCIDLNVQKDERDREQFFGDGNAAVKVIDLVEKKFL